MPDEERRPWPLPVLFRRRYKSRLRSWTEQEEARKAALRRGDAQAAAEAKAWRDRQTSVLSELGILARAQGITIDEGALREELREEYALAAASCRAARACDL